MATSNGRADLTEKQKQVLDALGKGRTVTEIARQQGVKANIIYSHLSRLRTKGYVDEQGNLVDQEQPPAVDLSGDDIQAAPPADSAFSLDESVNSMLDRQREALSAGLGTVRKAIEAHMARVDEIEKESGAHREAISQLKSQAEQAETALNALGGAVAEVVAI